MEQSIPATAARRRHRVLLVEDQTAIRQMLGVVLTAAPDFVVVGEAADGAEALVLLRRHQPDVIVLDWKFPCGGGGAFLRAMREERLQGQVLVMSACTGQAEIREALMMGAKGYVEKGAELDEFMLALRTVAEGGVHFCPVVAGVVEQMVKRTARARTAAPSDTETAQRAAGAATTTALRAT